MGLPFDAITIDQATEQIRQAAFNSKLCFFSTPNLNFLIAAQNNKKFRETVIRSDLSLPDGMPIIWLCKLLGIPIRERVAGSDVFEVLRKSHGRKIKVYFFGGQSGIAERAAWTLNAEGGGLECVGFETPGFGSISELSSNETISKINDSGAEFLVVSLGAEKGQAWIANNLCKINTPVISHLGAVINFVAGSVIRAPIWMRKIGLEWLWRIIQEPLLWRRYLKDVFGLIRILFKCIPVVIVSKLCMIGFRNKCIKITIDKEDKSEIVLVLSGVILESNIYELKSIFSRAFDMNVDIVINMGDIKAIDAAFAGLILISIDAWAKINKNIRIKEINWKVKLYLNLIGVGGAVFQTH
jgi:N-acetylglucosaminyldiphosphoundecaprenol N-acetyl-beta-D-mannosaminyltransferase